MSFDIAEYRDWLASEAGQKMLFKGDDLARALSKTSGVFMAEAFFQRLTGAGDNWNQLAVLDRLVELGRIREVKQAGPVATQDRIYRTVPRE